MTLTTLERIYKLKVAAKLVKEALEDDKTLDHGYIVARLEDLIQALQIRLKGTK